ncbi:MAG: AAA family ATPase [Candidatus Acidiferrales bacterium]|jgi:type II secretory pathway predicted ATPase ExeA
MIPPSNLELDADLSRSGIQLAGVVSEPEIRNTANDESAATAHRDENSERPLGLIERRGVDRLFLDYYGLNEQPFGVTPDLRFLYLGAKHREALDTLNYGTELNRGFLTLIAKPGMGKTSILFHYLEGLRDKARTVFLFQTDGDSTDLMRYMLVELGLDGKGMDLPEMRAVLSQVLMGEMQAGRRFILVIDEAQNLDEKVLESIRLLSNFETPWMKLMHIVLAGQPQLADRLAKPSMAQLRQRVSYSIRIEPFTREEVDLYINHRLWVAGYNGSPLFSIGARALIAERSEGIPRNINNICFCAMSFAWAMKRKAVDRDTMSEVLATMDPGSPIEKEVIAPKLPDEPIDRPNVNALQIPPPDPLTLKSPPARVSISTFAVACLLFLALCWFAFQPNVQKWMEASYNSISAVVRDFLVPVPAHVSPSRGSTVGPDNSSTSPKLEEPSDEKDIRIPQQDGIESSSTTGGRN